MREIPGIAFLVVFCALMGLLIAANNLHNIPRR